MDINKTVFNSLNKFGEIETAQINMFALSDKYKYPPYIKFRFKNLNKNDVVYCRIADIVSMYSGNVEWIVSTRPEIRNYIIVPKIFELFLYSENPFRKEYIVDGIGSQNYLQLVDAAIADIPKLSIWLTKGSLLAQY